MRDRNIHRSRSLLLLIMRKTLGNLELIAPELTQTACNLIVNEYRDHIIGGCFDNAMVASYNASIRAVSSVG